MTHEGWREPGYCDKVHEGQREPGNCEMLMKARGNLEVLKQEFRKPKILDLPANLEKCKKKKEAL